MRQIPNLPQRRILHLTAPETFCSCIPDLSAPRRDQGVWHSRPEPHDRPLYGQLSRRFFWAPNVRFGSKADIAAPPTNVRFSPKADIAERHRDVRFLPLADIIYFAAITSKRLGRTLIFRLVQDSSWDSDHAHSPL